MRRSKFIKQVLKSKHNTVFVHEDQVANALEVFEKIGMLPPDRIVEVANNDLGIMDESSYFTCVNEWEKE